MQVKKGAFILIDYTMKVKETGETIDTTIGEEAKKEGIFRESVNYEPILVVVGEGWVLKGLDDLLSSLEIKKLTSIEIPPEKAFGLRDPAQVKTIPARRLKGKNLYPGAQVEIEGKPAIVRTTGAGRVQIDFNQPLAGKTLIYDVTVKKILKKRIEKVKGLIHRRIPAVDIKNFKLKLTKKTFNIELPKEAFYIEGLQFLKRGIANDIQRFYSEVEKITFFESFKKDKPLLTDVKQHTQDPSQVDT